MVGITTALAKPSHRKDKAWSKKRDGGDWTEIHIHDLEEIRRTTICLIFILFLLLADVNTDLSWSSHDRIGYGISTGDCNQCRTRITLSLRSIESSALRRSNRPLNERISTHVAQLIIVQSVRYLAYLTGFNQDAC